MITATRAGRVITRNASFFKKIPDKFTANQEKTEEEENTSLPADIDDDIAIRQPQRRQQPQVLRQPEPGRRNPPRDRRLPPHFSDFVMN